MSNIPKKIKIKPTKRMLTHFKSEDYSIPLMLSEFIDNSISSWEKNNANTEIVDTKDRLKISIIFQEIYVNDEEREKKIIIKDNAAGMNLDEIERAVAFYDSEGKGENDLNQHGIGLKSALGWLGEDMIIYSKTKEEKNCFNVLEFNTTDFKVSDEWYVTAKQIDIDYTNKNFLLGDSGTTIIVDKIYDDDKFIYIREAEQRNALLVFLGWKYKYYIREGLILSLSFDKIDKDKDKNNPIEYIVGDFEIKPWQFSDFKTYISKKVQVSFKGEDSNNDKENQEIIYSKIIDDFLRNIKKIMEAEDCNPLKYNICDCILKDKPLLFKEEISINNSIQSVDWGIISSDSIKYNIAKNPKFSTPYSTLKNTYSFDALQGISTFHHRRGIEIGPFIRKIFWDKKMPQTISFARNRKGIDGESTPIRLYGEIHLIDFKTEINKAKLIWDESQLSKFKTILQNTWVDSFDDILKEIVRAETQSKSNDKFKLQTKTIEKTINESAEKMNFGSKDSIGDHECIDGKHNWIYKTFYNDNEYIFILIEDKLDKKPFKCSQVLENEYKIIYDFSHSIWHPINLDYTNARSLAHPIIVTLALAQWVIDQNQQTKSPIIFGKKSTRIDIFSIIDDLVKNWKQYE